MRKTKRFLALVLVTAMVVSGMSMKMIRNVTNVKADTEGESIYGTEGEYGYEILDNGTIKITGYCRSIDPPGTVSIDMAVVPSKIVGRDVTVIGVGAFRDCRSVTSIDVPDSVTTIENYAFAGTRAGINIPSTVTKIGSWAFSGCGGLYISGSTELFGITIPEGITEIEEGVFSNCTWLRSVVIPSSVTSIGNQAFEGCSELTSITVPDTVMSIGKRAFYNCTQLTEVKIPVNTTIEEDAFAGCDNLKIEYIEPTTEDSTTEETTKIAESTTEAPKATEPSTTTVIPTTTKESETTAGNISVGKTKVKKVTKKLLSKKAKISLKRISGAQYQVKVSATKKFKAKDTITKKVTKATLTINNKKIKNKKVLYVKARAYRVVDGKTYYGNWSKVKRVKVKK